MGLRSGVVEVLKKTPIVLQSGAPPQKRRHMMADQIDVVRELLNTVGTDLAFVVNHSGGKDSMRMLGFLRDHFPDSETYLVMADTGFEHQSQIRSAYAQLTPLSRSSLCGSLHLRQPIYPEICDRGSADRVRLQCARNVRTSSVRCRPRSPPAGACVCLRCLRPISNTRPDVVPDVSPGSRRLARTQTQPEREDTSMHRSLGKMTVHQLFDWRNRASDSIQQTVAEFLELGDAHATRWIQTAKGLMLLQMAPENPASGAVYVFDRQREVWYMFSSEGCDDQFTSASFDRIFCEYKLFSYVDQPGLLLSQLRPADA